jgi:hypothetical protein
MRQIDATLNQSPSSFLVDKRMKAVRIRRNHSSPFRRSWQLEMYMSHSYSSRPHSS